MDFSPIPTDFEGYVMDEQLWYMGQAKRFLAFGKEVRRKVRRYAECYDCIKFYQKGGCKGLKWVKGNKFSCKIHKWFPRVLAGEKETRRKCIGN